MRAYNRETYNHDIMVSIELYSICIQICVYLFEMTHLIKAVFNSHCIRKFRTQKKGMKEPKRRTKNTTESEREIKDFKSNIHHCISNSHSSSLSWKLIPISVVLSN